MENQSFDFHAPIAALKQQWRNHLKKIRQEIPPSRREEATWKAYQQLGEMCQEARFVLSFASFGSEINLWPFNQDLCDQGRLVLPLITAEKEILLFRVTDFDQLESHRWGMLEPKQSDCMLINSSLIDIALIPGLGFDRHTRHRLGYGLGYYDRLLSSHASLPSWGIGFLEQLVEGIPYSHRDIPLTHLYFF